MPDAPTPTRTALITGASSGIGAEFARRLAALGYDLVLVARRLDRLEARATELRSRHGIRTEVLDADLGDRTDCLRVEERLRTDPTLAVLVHAAGFGTLGTFTDMAVDREVAMIELHDVAAVRLTHAVLPGMVARGGGVIIHVSSIAAMTGWAGNVVYAASKAFINVFCQVLQTELQGTGVHIQVLCPGFTRTEFHDTPEYKDFRRSTVPAPLWMSAEDVVAHSLAGLKSGQVVVVPGLRYRLLVAAARFGLVQTVWWRIARRVRQLAAGRT
jgi:short-subunit dehydrogenase